MPLATVTDACREYARNVGYENQDQAWVCTPYDSWERNPFYCGPPARHPEDDDHGEDEGAPLDCLPAATPDSSLEVPFEERSDDCPF